MTRTPHISICVGTSCYVLGGAELINDVENAIDSGCLRARLSGTPCLGYCTQSDSVGDAPFAEVEGVVVRGATVDKIRLGVDESTEKR